MCVDSLCSGTVEMINDDDDDGSDDDSSLEGQKNAFSE